MQNYITSFSASKSSQFVNDQLGWDECSPHRHDCHDPPHGARVGFLDDRPPSRRLAAVARSDPWKVTRAQARFLGDATRRRRLPWVVGSDRWNNSWGKDSPRRYLRGEDGNSREEFCGVAGSRATYGRVEAIALVTQDFFLAQDNLASFPIRLKTRSWSFWFRFLKVAMHLLSRAFCEAPLLAGIASGSLSPSKNSW
jgi:hypothetical protein